MNSLVNASSQQMNYFPKSMTNQMQAKKDGVMMNINNHFSFRDSFFVAKHQQYSSTSYSRTEGDD
jgi:hypothetical protein